MLLNRPLQLKKLGISSEVRQPVQVKLMGLLPREINFV